MGDVLVVTGLFGRCWDSFSSVRLMPHQVLDVGCSCDTNRHKTESLHRNVDGFVIPARPQGHNSAVMGCILQV